MTRLAALPVLVVQAFIAVHTVDDREVLLNPREIVSITRAGGLVTQDGNCLIGTTDGKFVTVVEPCKTVVDMIAGKETGP